MTSFCSDCGKPNSGGLRCRECHGNWLRHKALEETAVRDRAILAAVKEEKLNGRRLAYRYGVTPVRGAELIRLATRREAARQERGI